MIQFFTPSGDVVYDARPVQNTTVRLSVTIGVDITGASSVQFGYCKPGSLTIAYWTATVDDPTTGAIHYDAVHDTPGIWALWYKVVQSDGKIIAIPAQSYAVVAEGQAVSP